ncbi:hypothetical protein VTI74DRAFT_3802 [Chaetomium olivicolor]
MVGSIPSSYAPAIPGGERYARIEVDANILRTLPVGVTVSWIATYGVNFWALSSEPDTIQHGGQGKRNFLKVYTTSRALDIVPGEFESTQLLAAVLPTSSPRLLSTERAPSHNGKFGFHVTTFSELASHGPDEEFQKLSEKILTKVIPRLIRPMETDGRRIQPVLLHGELWHGNVSVDNATDEPVLYDPCCFYGHNEYDLGMWRASRYLTNRAHVREYFKRVKPSEPTEDQDDRHALYAMQV